MMEEQECRQPRACTPAPDDKFLTCSIVNGLQASLALFFFVLLGFLRGSPHQLQLHRVHP